MKRNLFFSLAILLTGLVAQAQTPATTNIGRGRYPAVYPDGRVEFQIKAPEVQNLQVDLGRRYPMTKDDQGVWHVTTDPQGPGIHYYSLIVDGLSVADPASESFYGCGRMMSCVEIPYAQDGDRYALKDVPHGCVRTQYYFSKVTNSWRRMFVYTPAGYDTNKGKRYPVLYIMHGGGEDARGWVQQGRMDVILDNLAAEGRACPMIAVSFDANVGGYEPVEKEIMENVVPFVDANYRTVKDADSRALSGLSMGGIFTLFTGIPHYDTFHYLGVFSSGWFSGRNPMMGTANDSENSYTFLNDHLADFNNKVRLFWISQGGKEDIAYQNCQIMRSRLDKIGVKYQYYESAGGGHTWPVWREDIYLFAQKLFKK
jgi:enterochelin esterase-like enzyme